VHESAEILVAEGVVAHVLNKRTPIGEGVRFFQILGRRVWEALKEQRLNLILP
jgi:hypothetical protein